MSSSSELASGQAQGGQNGELGAGAEDGTNQGGVTPTQQLGVVNVGGTSSAPPASTLSNVGTALTPPAGGQGGPVTATPAITISNAGSHIIMAPGNPPLQGVPSYPTVAIGTAPAPSIFAPINPAPVTTSITHPPPPPNPNRLIPGALPGAPLGLPNPLQPINFPPVGVIPQNVMQVPPGSTSSPAPAIPTGGEPEACGLVSSRWHVAEAPSLFTTHNKLEVSFKPVPGIQSNLGTPTGNGLFSINLEKVLLSAEEVSHCCNGDSYDYHRMVVGSTKGVVKTARIFSLSMERATYITTVVSQPSGALRQPINIMPGFAAAFSTSTDEQAIRARRNFSSIFPDSILNPTDVISISTHGRALIDAGVESSRFMFRLAALVVETAFAQRENGCTVTIETQYPAYVTSTATWVEMRRAIADDVIGGETNYVPWHTLESFNPAGDVMIAMLIKLAASEGLTIRVGNQHRDVLIWPQIPNCRLLTSVALAPAIAGAATRLDIAPTDMNTAARMWVLRYGNMELFNQYVQFYSIMYWAKQGEALPICSPMQLPTIQLPDACMRGFLLAPFMDPPATQAAMVNRIEPINRFAMIGESQTAAMLIGYAATAVRWRIVDYALLQEILAPEEIETRMNIFRMIGGTVAFWETVQLYIKSLGYSGELGRMLGGVYSRQSSLDYLVLARTNTCRLQSGELLPFLNIFEQGVSAQGWVAPVTLDAITGRAGQYTMFGDMPAGKHSTYLPTLFETLGVDYFVGMQRRMSRGFDSEPAGQPPRLDSGCCSDFPMLAVSVQNGDRLRWAFILQNCAAFPLTEPTHDRYNLDWNTINLSRDPPSAQHLVISPVSGVSPDPKINLATVRPQGVYRTGNLPNANKGKGLLRRVTQAPTSNQQIPVPAALTNLARAPGPLQKKPVQQKPLMQPTTTTVNIGGRNISRHNWSVHTLPIYNSLMNVQSSLSAVNLGGLSSRPQSRRGSIASNNSSLSATTQVGTTHVTVAQIHAPSSPVIPEIPASALWNWRVTPTDLDQFTNCKPRLYKTTDTEVDIIPMINLWLEECDAGEWNDFYAEQQPDIVKLPTATGEHLRHLGNALIKNFKTIDQLRLVHGQPMALLAPIADIITFVLNGALVGMASDDAVQLARILDVHNNIALDDLSRTPPTFLEFSNYNAVDRTFDALFQIGEPAEPILFLYEEVARDLAQTTAKARIIRTGIAGMLMAPGGIRLIEVPAPDENNLMYAVTGLTVVEYRYWLETWGSAVAKKVTGLETASGAWYLDIMTKCQSVNIPVAPPHQWTGVPPGTLPPPPPPPSAGQSGATGGTSSQGPPPGASPTNAPSSDSENTSRGPSPQISTTTAGSWGNQGAQGSTAGSALQMINSHTPSTTEVPVSQAEGSILATSRSAATGTGGSSAAKQAATAIAGVLGGTLDVLKQSLLLTPPETSQIQVPPKDKKRKSGPLTRSRVAEGIESIVESTPSPQTRISPPTSEEGEYQDAEPQVVDTGLGGEQEVAYAMIEAGQSVERIRRERAYLTMMTLANTKVHDEFPRHEFRSSSKACAETPDVADLKLPEPNEFCSKEEFPTFKDVLKHQALGKGDWEATLLMILDRLLDEADTWENTLDLYNCLDACVQRIAHPDEVWKAELQAQSPISPGDIGRKAADLGKEEADLLDAAAQSAIKAFSWPSSTYNAAEEQLLQHTALLYLGLSCKRGLLECLCASAKHLGFNFAGLVHKATLLLEASVAQREVEAVRQQQRSAFIDTQLIAVDRQALAAALSVIAEEKSAVDVSECLTIGMFQRCKAAGKEQKHLWRQWSITLACGGCPKVLEKRFGGRWPRSSTRGIGNCSQYHHGFFAFRRWKDTLTPAQLSRFLLLIHPAVVGPEHYQALREETHIELTVGGVRWQDIDLERSRYRRELLCDMMEGRDVTGDNWGWLVSEYLLSQYGDATEQHSDMERRVTKGGMPVTYTIGIGLAGFPGAKRLMELLHNHSPQSDESEVVATATGLLSLPPAVLVELLASPLLDVPLFDWWHTFAKGLSRVRRSLSLGQLRFDESLLSLRKLLNVTVRTTEETNMDVEDWNRGMVITRKHLFGQGVCAWPKSAYTAYEEAFNTEAKHVVGEALTAQNEASKYRTIRTHWQERATRGAAGSSKKIKEFHVHDCVPELRDSDRPGKKVLVEFLDADALNRMVRWNPQQRAYFFVKPEPGHKQRALYATYDEESFVCAYANASIENTMGREPGVFVRQTPADVIEWCAVSQGGIGGMEGQGAYWVSTDYSDYNSEHTLLELMLLDRACAEWHNARDPGQSLQQQGNLEKAAAHNWCAAGRARSVILFCGSDEKFQAAGRDYLKADLDVHELGHIRPLLVTNGLFSGSRTTARDNTWIHAVDMRIAKNTMFWLGCSECMRWSAVCGDDEDVAFHDISGAAGYLTTLLGTNHNLNPIKQMGGAVHHEFLQFVNTANTRIEKARFTLLATLATGNWYVQKGVWIQSVLSAVIANYWELYCRGVPLQNCRRLAAATLDRVMSVPESEDTTVEDSCEKSPGNVKARKYLEWWLFRHSRGLAPLFNYNQSEPMEEQPRFEALIEPQPSWPRLASKDLVAMHRKLLSNLPTRVKKEMEEGLLASTVGASAKVAQQQAARRWASHHWPERSYDGCNLIELDPDFRTTQRDLVDYSTFRFGMPRKRELLTEEDIAGRMGVPFFLCRRLGGADKMWKYVTPEQWSKYGDVTDQFLPLSANGYELQNNLRAALTWSLTQVAPFHGEKRSIVPSRMLYVYMGNGAGKTHLNKLWKRGQDIDTVWMDAHGSLRQRADAAWNRSCFEPFSQNMQEILSIARKRSSVLMGQVDPGLIQKAAKHIGLSLDVCSFDPGEDIRRERLGRRADWDVGRVGRRIARSNLGYAACKEMGARAFSSADELLAYMRSYDAHTLAMSEQLVYITNKQPAKYVFNRTGPLSRHLEIEAEACNKTAQQLHTIGHQPAHVRINTA